MLKNNGLQDMQSNQLVEIISDDEKSHCKSFEVNNDSEQDYNFQITELS